VDYAEFYYINTLGYYPHDTDRQKLITKATTDYMLESGISEAEVIKAIETSMSSDCLTPDALPDWLWENSLVERDTYYCHHVLHLVPPAPRFNPHKKTEKASSFYLEMRIRFTIDQLVDYFYDTLMISKDLVDRKRDAGSFKYLLGKYSKLGFVQPLDFVLSLIDAVNADKNQIAPVTNVLDIARYEADVHDRLKRMTAQATLYKTNRIIWRSEQWKDS
jgi:hypothetical protein